MYTMKYFLLLAFAISVSGSFVFNDILGEEWQLFKIEHSKVYRNPLEEQLRKKNYLENRLKIIQHNRLYELGQVSFKLGLNKYSDLSHHEFVIKMNGGFNSSVINFGEFSSDAATFIGPDMDVPTSVDWREKGAVTSVKDQGDCGSCWAFATTGTLEGQFFRLKGKLISLSEQNLMDCSRRYGNQGCNGGFVYKTYKYIQDNGGIDTEQAYPYEAHDSRCRYDRKFNSGATVKGFVAIPKGDEEALKKAVATIGPIAVSMDASSSSFDHYREGVYYEPKCSSTNLDHAVLIVGYGTTTSGQDYWTVKNSWGTSWGQNGYFLMARNKKNNCGLATWASYPQV